MGREEAATPARWLHLRSVVSFPGAWMQSGLGNCRRCGFEVLSGKSAHFRKILKKLLTGRCGSQAIIACVLGAALAQLLAGCDLHAQAYLTRGPARASQSQGQSQDQSQGHKLFNCKGQ